MAKFVTRKSALSETSIGNHGTSSQIGTDLSAVTTDKGHVVIGLNVANVHTATVTVDIAMVDSSNNKIHICKSTSIPVGGNLDLVDGKIVITDTSEIHGACSVSNKAEVIVSVLENA
jgi:hypothetical protein|tara:strand:+ start:53 stop:403 length:351 start_codon:yes stop_codon:yes gene_type:complete